MPGVLNIFGEDVLPPHRQRELVHALAEELDATNVVELLRRDGRSGAEASSKTQKTLNSAIENGSLARSAGMIHNILTQHFGDESDLNYLASQGELEILTRNPEFRGVIDRLSGTLIISGSNRRAYRLGLMIALILGGWMPALTDGEFKADDVTFPVVFIASELLKELEKAPVQQKQQAKSTKNVLQKGSARRRRKKRR
jgi:hypothetical protein